MFIKTKGFLIYRPIKYCVTSVTLKLLKHDVSNHSINVKVLLLVDYFHVPDHHLWQVIPTTKYAAEADIDVL